MIHLGNCIELMRGLPDASVDALISDPPYGVTALAFDKHPIDWAAWWQEAKRVTKPTAPIVLFAQQPFTTDLIVSNRKMFRYLLVWEKTRPTGFLDANRRPLRAHEDVLIFAQQMKGSTYNPQMVAGKPYFNAAKRGKPAHYSGGPVASHPRNNESGDRHPKTVIKFANPNNGPHPTQKPLDLMRWLVATYTNPGDTVLDCFAGSGTTGVACVQLGREFIGYEMNPEYHALAAQRIAETQPDTVLQPLPPEVGLFAAD